LDSRAEGLQHMLQVVDTGHDEAAYVFGILTVKNNKSSVEVEEALVHVDKFITPSLSDPVIRRWIRSVRYDVVLTLRKYEEVDWGRRFFHLVQDLPQCVSGVPSANLPKRVER
jgi:hypothetical protein